MSDITNCFKDAIKDIKKRPETKNLRTSSQNTLLNRKRRSQFSIKSKDVIQNISKLEEFLVSHRKDYINASGVLGRVSSKMTDSERDQIDADAETFIKTCNDAIRVLRTEAQRENVTGQVHEHRCSVLDSLIAYLKDVCRTYSAQRAIRVKRVVDNKKISRLESERKPHKAAEKLAKNKNSESKPDKKASKASLDHAPLFADDDADFSAEEAAELAQENMQLYHEMNSVVDEVKQIEGKVVEISRLQEFFSDKILEQEKDIDRIGGTVVGSVENIKDANDEIREAMRNNAGLRVWILFFLIVLSVSLLFLDWYNP